MVPRRSQGSLLFTIFLQNDTHFTSSRLTPATPLLSLLSAAPCSQPTPEVADAVDDELGRNGTLFGPPITIRCTAATLLPGPPAARRIPIAHGAHSLSWKSTLYLYTGGLDTPASPPHIVHWTTPNWIEPAHYRSWQRLLAHQRVREMMECRAPAAPHAIIVRQ